MNASSSSVFSEGPYGPKFLFVPFVGKMFSIKCFEVFLAEVRREKTTVRRRHCVTAVGGKEVRDSVCAKRT